MQPTAYPQPGGQPWQQAPGQPTQWQQAPGQQAQPPVSAAKAKSGTGFIPWMITAISVLGLVTGAFLTQGYGLIPTGTESVTDRPHTLSDGEHGLYTGTSSTAKRKMTMHLS